MKLETIERKIDQAKKYHKSINANYLISDSSVQAELRLSVQYSINYLVDHIHYPKNLDHTDYNNQLWARMREIEREINTVAEYVNHREDITIKSSIKTVKGQRIRERAEAEFRRLHGEEFLEIYRQANLKSSVSRARKEIERLQREQMQLIPEMRAHNSAYLSERKNAKDSQRKADQEALASGEFWRASEEAIKNYFHPPFTRNYVADVSERWRACLIVSVVPQSYKGGYGWYTKLEDTGHGYLCGIDDNGDEWGHEVEGWYGSTVETAMARLFGIDWAKLDNCTRQGDLLFCPVQLRKEPIEGNYCERCGHPIEYHVDGKYCPETASYPPEFREEFKVGIIPPIEMHEQPDPWEIRESHMIQSDKLMRNGRHFSSPNPITITHTSHQTVVLEPGEYRLYELQVADAD